MELLKQIMNFKTKIICWQVHVKQWQPFQWLFHNTPYFKQNIPRKIKTTTTSQLTKQIHAKPVPKKKLKKN